MPRRLRSRAASANAPRSRWPSRWLRTCCCSTSRPTTSTSTASRRSKNCCSGTSPASSSRTTGASSTRWRTRIAELDRGILRTFPGNYSVYEERKAEIDARRRSRASPLREILGAGRSLDPQGRRGAPHAQRRPREAPRASARGTRGAARAHRPDQAHRGYRRTLRQAGRRARECRQEFRRAAASSTTCPCA